MSKPTDHWYTPNTADQPCIELVENVLGGIGLDCTADPDHRVPAKLHYTEEDNCLVRTAQGLSIFCNPPFSNPLPFVQWVSRQVLEGNSPEAIMLLKIGTLANKGTGFIIGKYASATCEWRYNGRIRFIPSKSILERLYSEYKQGLRKTPCPTGADFDCVFVYFGQNYEKFIRVFSGYGNCALRESAYKQLIGV